MASTNVATAELIAEAAEIPYQINHSDRIIIGTVTDIQPFYDYTIVTIGVDEWLMNPLSTEIITVRTKIGTTVVYEDEPTFALNETIILMLEDVNISEDRFGVVFGEPGKHPLSDRDAVLQELAAREQAQNEGNSAPDNFNFVVLTEEELNEYPALKEAITSQSIVKVRPDEWQRSFDFLSEKGSHTVKFGDMYYAIGFMTA